MLHDFKYIYQAVKQMKHYLILCKIKQMELQVMLLKSMPPEAYAFSFGISDLAETIIGFSTSEE